MSAIKPRRTPRKRCTCMNQMSYFGSYYCTQDIICREKQDRTWWRRLFSKRR